MKNLFEIEKLKLRFRRDKNENKKDYININASNPRLTSPQTADLTALKKVK